MEQEKPFKTIEVIDTRTRQTCKVACMSCIRGHRTTSCGIPVCRTKIFWTVKRPGRPSNSCTCRYGATGGCKCVVAKSACPHKSKKGEKRTGECRCDEQGRYCCLIEPEHWTALLSLEKPAIEFHPTREALEARQTAAVNRAWLQTPSLTTNSPHASSRMSSMPPSTPSVQPIQFLPDTYNGYPPASSTLTPRFGVMGIGAPMDSTSDIGQDVLTWEGQRPVAPSDFNLRDTYHDAQSVPKSCCQQVSSPPQHSILSPQPQIPAPINLLRSAQDSAPLDQMYDDNQQNRGNVIVQPTTAPPAWEPAPFDFDRLQADYFNYQFPSAICQNCGLNGCTCRNCPPIFQNFGTTSWAQCCGRKHARDMQPTPPPIAQKIPRTDAWTAEHGTQLKSADQIASKVAFDQTNLYSTAEQGLNDGFADLTLPVPADSLDFDAFDLEHNLILPEGMDPINLSDFLLSDIDRSNHNNLAEDDDARVGDGSGKGGCCCGD